MTKEKPDQIECYIIVDVETSGPSPCQYAQLSIGACTMEDPRQTFYVELHPDSARFTQEAMSVNQLSLDRLAEEGSPPAIAMQEFANWIEEAVIEGAQPVFTAFNAPFDWMFINDYFHRYLGYNPFGHKALDIKAYFMGFHGVSWLETSHVNISHLYSNSIQLTHHALNDAIAEADIFQAMLSDKMDLRREVDD